MNRNWNFCSFLLSRFCFWYESDMELYVFYAAIIIMLWKNILKFT